MINNTKTATMKQKIAGIFDEKYRQYDWQKYAHHAILMLILLSMLSIFLSTYDDFIKNYGDILKLIDYGIIAIFSVEIACRIWCADLSDNKYQGFIGRIRYCLSFYGLMDILSTYAFLLTFIFPIQYLYLQILRTFRLFRIFRYLKALDIFARAIKLKKDEMWVSLQFLSVFTLILAFILYFVEHQAQPDVYNNGLTSVLWAFLQYIGDPGGFADTPPITTIGRVIANIIGILTIAIFAVPAGLIASAFSEIMEEDRQEAEFKNFQHRITRSFRFNHDRQNTALYYCPRYQPLITIITRKYMSETDIIKTVGQSDCFHLFNLANAISPEENPTDRIVVVNYKKNTPYGCCIDRDSKITIVSTSGFVEPITSWFAYHIAKIGGFNYVAKEIESYPDNPVSYYWIDKNNECLNISLFLSDINRLSNKEGSWVFPILGAVAPLGRANQFHFSFAPKKGDETYDDSNISIKDIGIFEEMYRSFQNHMNETYNIACNKNRYYGIGAKTNIARFLNCQNVCTLRLETKLFVFDSKAIAYAKAIADIFNKHFESDKLKEIPNEMRKHDKENAFGMNGYQD